MTDEEIGFLDLTTKSDMNIIKRALVEDQAQYGYRQEGLIPANIRNESLPPTFAKIW
jgi:hypothetical protein